MIDSQLGAWRLLWIEHEQDEFSFILSLLDQTQGREVRPEVVKGFDAGMKKLQEASFDAVLVSDDLGMKTGIDLIQEAVAQGKQGPFILIKDQGGYEVDIEATQAGAALCLAKDELNPSLLERAIRCAIQSSRVEQGLLESDQRYRMLFNSMLDGFALYEVVLNDAGNPVDYHFLQVNTAFEQMTGLKGSEIIGKSVLQVLPQIGSHWIETYGEVALNGMPVRFENYSGSLGRYFDVVAFSPRKNQFAAIFTDISERKRMEAALQEREQQYRSLFDNHHTVMLLIDPESNRIIDANPAAVNYYGYSIETIKQLKISDINVLSPEEVRVEVQKAVREERNHFLFRHRKANGEVRDVEVYSGPIVFAGKKVLYSIINDISDRLQKEQELKRISLFPSENPNPVMRINQEGVLLYANRSSAPLIKDWQCDVGQVVPQAWIRWIREAANMGSAIEVETEFEGIAYSCMLQPVLEGGYVNLYAREITGQRQAKQALDEHLARLQKLIAISIQLLTEQTQEGLFQKILAGARELTGAGVGVIEHQFGEQHFDVSSAASSQELPECPPVDKFQIPKGGVYQAILENTSIRLTREELRHYPDWHGLPEGHLPLFGLLGTRLVGHDGRNLGFILLSHKEQGDFTAEDEGLLVELSTLGSLSLQHIQARKEAERQADKLDAVINSMADAVVIYDDQGKLLQLNPAAIEAYGFDPLGENRLEVARRISFQHLDGRLVRPEDLPSSRAFRGQVITNAPLRFMNAKGRELSVLTSGAPVEVEGKLAGAVIVFRDITEWEAAQAALREYAARLEQANRELQDFTSIASHDLQEPLRKIQMFGDRLQNKYISVLDEEGLDYLQRMGSAAARMSRMINDLLAYSRVSTQKHPFTLVNLTEVANQVVADLEARIEQTGGTILIEELPAIMAKEYQMSQLFLNLISNALKFHNPGVPPVVKISSQVLPPSGWKGVDWVQIRFEDNGVGFDMEYQERIFQPFQRLYGRTSFEGTGIGLSICRKIAEIHGGSITVESTPGKGSTFIVNLPVSQP